MWALGTGTHSVRAAVGALLVIGAAAWIGRSVLQWPRRVPIRWAIRCTAIVLSLGTVLAIAGGGRGRLVYLLLAMAVPFFVVGAVCYRWTAFRVRRSRTFLGFALVLAAAAVVVAPGGPASMFMTPRELHDVRAARAVVGSATAALHERGVRGGPVVVRADGLGSYFSYQTALVLTLATHGYTPYYDSPWPHPEDDAFRRTGHAPSRTPTVTLRDGRPPLITQ